MNLFFCRGVFGVLKKMTAIFEGKIGFYRLVQANEKLRHPRKLSESQRLVLPATGLLVWRCTKPYVLQSLRNVLLEYQGATPPEASTVTFIPLLWLCSKHGSFWHSFTHHSSTSHFWVFCHSTLSAFALSFLSPTISKSQRDLNISGRGFGLAKISYFRSPYKITYHNMS